jgi:beta-lactamase superfamily II metal-dependent hydrolase
VIGATRDDRYFMYDAGGTDQACLVAAREIIRDGAIDLLIVSHVGAGHTDDLPGIVSEFRVGEIWWTGNYRPTVSYRRAAGAIEAARTTGTAVRNLSEAPIAPGTRVAVGAAQVSFVAGWARWPADPELGEEDLRKLASIVARVDYGNASMLLMGDSLGRLPGAPDDDCRYAEAQMAANDSALLRADVMLAPNHGADDASAGCLIAAVGPGYVIFPAGHADGNPRIRVANRYLAVGIPANQLLRTDRGDDEGELEWPQLRSAGCRDWPGDDDIEILLTRAGPPAVRYLRPNDLCLVPGR